jgi:hypothetical protein
MFKKQHLISALWLSAPLFLPAGAAAGAESPSTAADPSGFYGGISLRDSGRDADGLSFGHLSSVWSRFTLPTMEDKGARTLAYGGYRWANDLSVEAALATVDRYALQPALSGGRRGVGLALGTISMPAARSGTSMSSRAGNSARAFRSTAAWVMRKAIRSRRICRGSSPTCAAIARA